MLCRPTLSQIFSSAQYSQTPSAYIPPPLSVTMCLTHISDQVSHPYQWPCVSPISVTMCLTHISDHVSQTYQWPCVSPTSVTKSHPYQLPCVSPISVTMRLTHTKQQPIILGCILIFSKLEDKIFSTDWQQALPDIKLLLISSAAFYFDSLRCSVIFYFFPPSKGTIISFYIVTSFCILVFRHDHVLSFISVYF